MAETKRDAITLLTQDHTKVKKLFRQFEGLGDRAMKPRQELYATIRRELEIHTTLEEQLFYPAAREVTEDLVPEALEEHRVVKQLLMELADLDPSDERFDAKMTVLIEQVEHHAEEEEKELFPKAKKELPAERLRALGTQMAEQKQLLLPKFGAAS